MGILGKRAGDGGPGTRAMLPSPRALEHRLTAERVAPISQEGSHQGPQEAEGIETETSGGEQRGRRPTIKSQTLCSWEKSEWSLPYLLASLGAQAACTCPVQLWLPGVVGGRKPSMGHLFSAGQLPPAELLVRLFVHHQQPSLPFHSLDPLHHLGRRVGGSKSAVGTPGSTWTVAPPRAGPGSRAGSWPTGGGRLDREARRLHPPPPGLRQLPPSLPRTPDTGLRGLQGRCRDLPRPGSGWEAG